VSIDVETTFTGEVSIVLITGKGPALPVSELVRTSEFKGKGKKGGENGGGKGGGKEVEKGDTAVSGGFDVTL
jgi:hypothetical protein